MKQSLKAGNGGDGCCSFFDKKYMPKEDPMEEMVEKGGDSILQATRMWPT